jgi:ATP-dependent DNA helicase HFM1/MER3
MSDYYIFMKHFKEAINALTLSKCLQQRLWEDSTYQLKQLSGIGMVTAKVPICHELLFPES